MRLDEVVTGKADFRAVIDGIAAAAHDVIDALLKRGSGRVDLTTSTPLRRFGRRRTSGQAAKHAKPENFRSVRSHRGTNAAQTSTRKPAAATNRAQDGGFARPRAPTAKMVAYAQSLSRGKKVTLPEGFQDDFDACRRFLDENSQ
jgi:DNA topoisomerase-3